MAAAKPTLKIGTLPSILPNFQAAAPANFNFWTQPNGISRPPVFNIPWLNNLSVTPPPPPPPVGGVGSSGGVDIGGSNNNGGVIHAPLLGDIPISSLSPLGQQIFGGQQNNQQQAQAVLPPLFPQLIPDTNGLLPNQLFGDNGDQSGLLGNLF